jgi:hypothetical protein
MTPQDLIADLRSRINPSYAATLGTESYERRLCAGGSLSTGWFGGCDHEAP